MPRLVLISFAAALLMAASARAQTSAPSSGDLPSSAAVTDLVYANRILYDQGILDGFGHVSVREENNPERFLLSRSMAPGLVTARDIMEFDLQGAPINARDRAVYLERFIHAAIYRARPDVKAIIHSHSAGIIPFGITGTPLRPVYHMGAFLGVGVPVFDIREVAGDTDLLISNLNLGDLLAKALGDKPVVLMRGHGSVVTGNSIQQVVFRAIYTEANSRIQSEAMKLGAVTFLTPQEAAKAAATNDTQVGRAWDLWKRRIVTIEP